MKQDLRLALRAISAHRWFAAAVIVILALGIGINTTVFSLVNAVLFKPLPFPGGDRLVVVSSQTRGGEGPVSYRDYEDYRDQSHAFESLEALLQQPAVLAETGVPPERVDMAFVSSGLFEMLHASPSLGRGLGPDDERQGAEAVVLISEALWRQRYGGAAGVIGRTVRVNEQVSTIVGVMPLGVQFLGAKDLWMPLVPSSRQRADRNLRDVMPVGLLRPGVALASAQADVAGIAGKVSADHPDTNKDTTARVMTFHDRFNGGQVKFAFLLMLGAVGFVLLIACANVANLMLSRSIGRSREVAIRSALGASRWRIVRELLVESLVLSLLGGLAGLAIGIVGTRAFALAVANVGGKPSWVNFSMDGRVLAYCGLLCMTSSVIFGLAPALRSARVDLNSIIKSGTRSVGSHNTSRMSATLVVLQFSLAMVLLAGAGLLIRGWAASLTVNAFVPSRAILTAQLELPRERYPDSNARQRFWDALIGRLSAVAGSERVGLSSALPGLDTNTRVIEVEGAGTLPSQDRPRVGTVTVSPDYFRVVNLPLAEGRGFDSRDTATGVPVAIVARDFATRFWPGETAVGKRFRFNQDNKPGPWQTVIGTAGVVTQDAMASSPVPVLYLPLTQDERSVMRILIRSTQPLAVAPLLRREAQALDQDLPLFDVRTLQDGLDQAWWFLRVFGGVFLIFATVALAMAAVGIYAVVAQSTSRRTREIGIRMALGATSGRILSMVVARGARQLGLGLVLGLIAALGLASLMKGILFGVSTSDPFVFGCVTLALGGVGLVACWLPARRAAALHPVRALQED